MKKKTFVKIKMNPFKIKKKMWRISPLLYAIIKKAFTKFNFNAPDFGYIVWNHTHTKSIQLYISYSLSNFLPFGAFLFSFMITICLIICQTNCSYKPSIPKQHLSEEKEKHFTFKRIQMLSNWKNLPICQNKCTIAMKNKTPSPFEHWKMAFHLCKTLKIINNIFNLSYKHRINWKTFILTKSATELFSMFFLVFNAKWFILALKFIQLNAFRLLQISN